MAKKRSRILDVVNQTALEGRYDADVNFSTVLPTTPNFVNPGEGGAPPTAISLRSAVRDDLGVRLDVKRVPVEFLRIDAAVPPVLN